MTANPRQEYEAKFREILAGLNAAQRRAVDQTEGPVMVLAGPGTGKTHLLAARIGNILLTSDAGAHNILCLTFTDAGVKAMRDRLLEFIGPEAHRIHLFTFHGFCSRVIQDNLQFFGRPGLEPLGELEQIRVIREILEELPSDNPLRRGYNDVFQWEEQLRNIFQDIKAENWDTDRMVQAINRFSEGLQDHPDYQYKNSRKGKWQVGDPHWGNIAEERRRMDKLRAGVELFETYQDKLRRLKRYDYGDMIGWVLRAFNDHPTLLRSYQERYQYLLVDEYQDTNGSQNEVITQLTRYWDDPNVFIVGDDDQAIYEFQGARLRSMVDFFHGHRNVAFVTLTENYRSRAGILESATQLIGYNQLRIAERLPDEVITEKELTAARAFGEEAELPEAARVLAFDTHRQEVAALIQQLRAWHAAGTPWNEMAVLYARHRQVATLTHLLERSGIPYRSKRRPNVLDNWAVRQLLTLLEYLQLEYERPGGGEHLLYRLLHQPHFDLAPGDLARLNLDRLRTRSSDNRPITLREYLSNQGLMDWLELAIASVATLPLPELVEFVLNDSGLLGNVLRHPDKLELTQYLTSFSGFVLDEVARRPRLDLGELLETLRQMDANRVELPLRTALDQGDAVLLVTAHSSKGLEFDKVWLFDCSKRSWRKAVRGSNKFTLPDTLTYSGAEDEEEARRRLFFVALTRAKTEVVIGYSERDARGKAGEYLPFIDELPLPVERRTIPQAQLDELNFLYLSPRDPAQAPLVEESIIREALTTASLSVSSLYAYLDCPLRYYYEQLLGVPDTEREQATYGSALHDALELYFARMLRNTDRAFPSRAELLYYYEQALGRRRGRLTRPAYDRLMRQGKEELHRYHDTYRSSWTQDAEVERYLSNITVDGVPLTGKIDRIDTLNEAYVRVVDYKTSSSRTKKISRPTEKNPHGSPYWRQLTFYKVLYDNSPGQLRRVREGQISFLLTNPDGKQPTLTHEFTQADTTKLREILRETWASIQAMEFGGCGKEECEWCRFAEDQRKSTPRRTEGQEDIDDG